MKSNIYTRTGDNGTTSLVDGSRTGKADARVEAYGDIDELSSALGLAAASSRCPDEIKGEFHHIQHLLFEIGGYLATPVASGESPGVKGMDEETALLEGWIDSIDERLPKLRNFILPGGSEEGARCHLARTICRRAERRIVTLAGQSHVDSAVGAYINRLSDYLFIVARYLNFINGVEETAWQPR